MKRRLLLLTALLLLAGCETLNDAMVRHMLKEPGLSGKVRDQIQEGLEKREKAPQPRPREVPAPTLDQG